MNKQELLSMSLTRSGLTKIVLAVGAVTLSACASKPPAAGDYLTTGESSINMARAAGADEYAAVELNNARVKLERARMLAQQGKRVEAQALAQEADADAQVAQSKAAAERSARALNEVEESLRALRNQSTTPTTP